MKNIINVKSQTKLSSFTIVYHGSTMNEKPGWYGLSHLMEHLMCKSFEHLYDDLDRDGITWNAYTSDTNVVIFFRGLEEHIEKYKYKILKLLRTNFKIDEKILENEKKIVLEEYGDTFNNQLHSHILNLFRKKFNRYTAIGLKSDIENISLEDINTYYNCFFKNPSKIINVVNDENYYINNLNIDFGDTFKDEKIIFGTYDNDFEIMNEYKDKRSIIMLSPIIEENIPEYKTLVLMLGFNLKSPLMKELREKKGLVYSLNLSTDNLNDKQGFIYLMAQTRNENTFDFIESVNDIFNKPEEYMTKERFDIIKDLVSTTFQKNEIERYKNVNKFIRQEKFDLEKRFNNLIYDDVMKVYNDIFKKEWYTSIDNEEF